MKSLHFDLADEELANRPNAFKEVVFIIPFRMGGFVTLLYRRC